MEKNTILAVFAGLTGILLLGMISVTNISDPGENINNHQGEVNTFNSEEEFARYIEAGSVETVSQTSSSSSQDYAVEDSAARTEEIAESDEAGSQEVTEGERIHTDGERLYYSTTYPEHTHVFNELPNIELEHNISSTGGDLFSYNENVIVTNRDKIESLDKEEMSQNWERTLDSRLIEAQQLEDEMIILTRERVNGENPCPRPIEGFETSCSNIIYPGFQTDVDYTYTVAKINLENGEIENTQSFTADRSTEIHVNAEKTVFTYTWEEKESVIITDFLENYGYELLDQETIDRIEQIKTYELSERSINYEISQAMESFLRENPETEEELERRMDNYLEENKREFSETTIVAINNSDFERIGDVSMPGSISNIENSNQETLLISQVGGYMSGERENDLHLINEEFSDYETYRGLSEDHVSSISVKEENVFISERNKVISFDLDRFEILDMFESRSIGNLEVIEGYVLNLENDPEDRDQGTTISVLNDEFETIDSVMVDEEHRIYSASVFGESDDGFKALLSGSGYHGVLEFEVNSSEIQLNELENRYSNGLTIEENIYLFTNNRVSVFDNEFSEISSMNLDRERDDRPVRPMPEPAS